MRPLLKNIFLADDDIDDVDIFRFALDDIKSDFKLVVCSNGKELLDTLANSSTAPDIMFIDINMPVLNGHEALKRIRQVSLLKDIPVVIYSTSANEYDIHQAMENGAAYYMVKPSDIHVLTKMIKKLIAFEWKDYSFFSLKDEFVMKG